MLAERMGHLCVRARLYFPHFPTNHAVHSRKGRAEGISTGKSLVFASDMVWVGFNLSHGGGQTRRGCFTAEHGGTRPTSRLCQDMDGWMDGADEHRCASLHMFMWVYEKGNTTSLSHFYLPAGSSSEPLPSHMQRAAIYWMEKKIRNLGKKSSGGLTSRSGKQRNHLVRGLRKPRVLL